MPDSIYTTCPYCGVGCGVRISGKETVSGDLSHPANGGRLCSKGSALGETLGTDGRLLEPRLHGRPVDWNTALDHVAGRFSRTVAEHGPDAVAFYVSGQLLTEDYYVANKLMKGFIGSANIDTNSRLCMASSVAGHIRAFGEDVVPGCYEDWELAELVVLVGSNAAWCHPVLFQRLLAARDRKGTRIVVIDPRRSATAAAADLHLAVQSGTDVLLFNGLLAHLARSGAIDHTYIAAHTAGFGDALTTAEADAAQVAAGCGLSEADVQRFYDWFAATPRTLTVYSQGVNQSSRGTDKVNAIINCHLATGRIGRPGASPFSVTGQPNAMGGREVGGMANQLAAHMGFDDPAALDRVRRFWQAPNLVDRPGLKAVDMFDAVASGRIKAIWIMATNPAVSLPDANRVRAGLKRCDFVAVSDCVAETDTTALAHVLLPAASWGEKNGTVTNSERRLSRQRQFRAPPGLARPDWWIIKQVAQRMGFSDAFSFASAAAIFREYAALTAFENDGTRLLDLGGLVSLDDAAYDRLLPVQWPLRRGQRDVSDRLLADGRFPTADGRGRFVAVAYIPPVHQTDETRTIVLNSGRLRDQWHTMTHTGRVPRLAAHAPEPQLDLNPADAQRVGVSANGLVRVESAWGHAIARARLTEDQPAGSAFLPMHWNDTFTAACVSGTVANPATDTISGQPEFKHTPVALQPVPVEWVGCMLSRRRFTPAGIEYWTRTAVDGGYLYELAGSGPVGAMAAVSTGLLGADPALDTLEYRDDRRGILRIAKLSDQGIADCLSLGVPGTLPPRSWLLEVFAAGMPLDALTRQAVLSGRSPTPQEDEGRMVCACFRVGINRIARTIRAGAATPAALGAILKAGTNCGSCVSELKEIIAHEMVVAAE